MPNKTKTIKTKNVIFDHSKFYNFIELNLTHILTLSIKSIVEMLNLSEMSLIFSEINETEKFEKKIVVIENLIELNEISSIKNTTSESIEKKNLNKTRTLMSISETTSEATPKRIIVQEENPDTMFNPEAPNSIRRFRRASNSDVSSDAIAMNIKSQRQAYAAAMSNFSDFAFFYSAFAMGLIKSEIDSKIRLHRDSFSIEPQH